MLAGLRQLVKLVAQDLALIQATWPRRYQTGVSRVIYNFAHEIIGLKNHWGYQCVNLYYPGDKGCPSDSGGETVAASSFSFLGECTVQSAILCVSLRKIRGQRSKRMVISSLGCVCFHFAHVCADKV